MLAFIVFLLTHFVLDPPRTYSAWHDWMMDPAISISASVFVAALLVHARVGVRDVILDYVHPIAIRMPVLAVIDIGLVAVGTWVIRILWFGYGG